MTNFLTIITVVSYSAACLRLLAYRRGLGNYRLKISIVAWCLILFTGTSALELLLHPRPTSIGTTGIAVTLCILIWRARGNVASITRSQP